MNFKEYLVEKLTAYEYDEENLKKRKENIAKQEKERKRHVEEEKKKSGYNEIEYERSKHIKPW